MATSRSRDLRRSAREGIKADVDMHCSRAWTSSRCRESRLEEQYSRHRLSNRHAYQALRGEQNDAAFDIDPNHLMDSASRCGRRSRGAAMKPLCREDCAGLCPICGTNRNERQCDCQVETVDSRCRACVSFVSKTSRGDKALTRISRSKHNHGGTPSRISRSAGRPPEPAAPQAAQLVDAPSAQPAQPPRLPHLRHLPGRRCGRHPLKRSHASDFLWW